jgi:hypothetical protein
MIYQTLDSETIEIILRDQNQPIRWTPSVGQETLVLLDRLKFPEKDRETLKSEAVAVLAQCVPPMASEGKETGLIIGYVQSGKTTSFTTVTALARDNGYRLVIVITGITRNLFGQSKERIEEDLRLRERHGRKWRFFHNPKSQSHVKQSIAAVLERSGESPGVRPQTVLITVMKNTTHLKNLIKLLSDLSLNGIPALVIDDEADQASLNNKVNKGEESATYRCIVKIRQLLPHHTFLQYTATPQAPLLINLIDILSPRFAAILTPGPAYTGGKVFFEQDFRLIRRIRSSELPTKDCPLTEPPDSLLEAMRVFFLGVAAGLKNGEGEEGNRSMMVHPSKETMLHADYALWVQQTQKYWAKLLTPGRSDADSQDLINDFKEAYADLRNTVEDLPSFQDLQMYLPSAVKDTVVTKVNAKEGPTPQPEWNQVYAHILVGGEVLNRGYTIEGLTVTYMPRGKGVGNADTVQQRARWFGYKANYLGYCRVYLTDETSRIYRHYVDHEEDTRGQLRQHRASGKSLREWRRAFLLSSELRPTRHSVLDLEYIRGNFSHDWYTQKAPHDSHDAVQTNREIVREFLAKLSFQPDTGHASRTDAQKHLVASNVSLSLVYSELLTKFLVTRASDAHRFIGLLLQIAHYLDQYEDEECTIYLMKKGESRERTVNADDEIPTLFQGANPATYYAGDTQVRAAQGVTVQIHNLEVRREDHKMVTHVIAENVPTIAIWLPKKMSAGWIVQTESQASEQFAGQYWKD